MCKMQNAENEYKESVQTYVSELQFRKQYSSLRIMHFVPLNHIYSEYTIKAQQFELLRLYFSFTRATKQPVSARWEASCIALLPLHVLTRQNGL